MDQISVLREANDVVLDAVLRTILHAEAQRVSEDEQNREIDADAAILLSRLHVAATRLREALIRMHSESSTQSFIVE